MSEKWTKFDWASNLRDLMSWADEEERLLNGIDKRMRKTTKR